MPTSRLELRAREVCIVPAYKMMLIGSRIDRGGLGMAGAPGRRGGRFACTCGGRPHAAGITFILTLGSLKLVFCKPPDSPVVIQADARMEGIVRFEHLTGIQPM